MGCLGEVIVAEEGHSDCLRIRNAVVSNREIS